MTPTDFYTNFHKSKWVGRLMKVYHVDMWGFTGRDYHPESTDLDAVGLIVGADIDDFLLIDEPKEEDCYIVLSVILQDGRYVQFIDHEIKLI